MVRILHAADLHLDSPFSSLPPEEAQRRRALQRQLPERIAALANHHRCDLLLLAGDIFDGTRICPETVEALQRAFSLCRARIFIAPGNHDPYGDRSPWALARWPEHVHIFTGAPEAVTLPELGCRIWGGGFTGPVCAGGLPPAAPCGLIQIGVYHGDPENPGPYRPLSRQDIAASGLDYLALGHIHRPCLPKQLGGTRYGWPGVTMGRGFDECGPCGVLLAEVAPGAVSAEFLPLDNPRYEILTAAPGQTPDLPPDSQQVICRLLLTGEGNDPDPAWLQRQLAPRFLALEVQDRRTPRQDLWEACGDGTLRGLALETLRSGGSEDAALAARYVLAALEGRDGP